MRPLPNRHQVSFGVGAGALVSKPGFSPLTWWLGCRYYDRDSVVSFATKEKRACSA